MIEKSRYKYKDEILNICNRRHLTADEILEKIKRKNPRAGQATIYRTIKFLADNNFLNRISLAGKNYYEKNIEFHGHLIEKNKIKDFEISEKFLKEVEKKIGKKIKGLELKIFI